VYKIRRGLEERIKFGKFGWILGIFKKLFFSLSYVSNAKYLEPETCIVIFGELSLTSKKLGNMCRTEVVWRFIVFVCKDNTQQSEDVIDSLMRSIKFKEKCNSLDFNKNHVRKILYYFR